MSSSVASVLPKPFIRDAARLKAADRQHIHKIIRCFLRAYAAAVRGSRKPRRRR